MHDTVSTWATGGSATSQADSLEQRSWSPRPWVSMSIRVAVFVIPLLMSVVAVRIAVGLVSRPQGWLGFWIWMAALIVVSAATAACCQRLMRRFAPLGALYRMSLVFPDEAPSRFRTAMRAGSSRSLARGVNAPSRVGSPEQAAAEDLVDLMARLNRHDRLTRGHSERVRAYSVMLGEEIRLSSGDLEKLSWAALIHDIGKLDVPGSILNKRGRPNEEEWAVLRRHPGAGADYVEPLRVWLGHWVDASTQHHERYDGLGYPHHRSGTEISLGGRIVAIADAFDVMTAARSYKKPLPPSQARAELLRNAGTQFDPGLVRGFLEISLGRMRWVLGPLGWLAYLPDIVRAPITAATASGTVLVTAGAVALGAATGATAAADAPTPGPTQVIANGPAITDGSGDRARTPNRPTPTTSDSAGTPIPATGDETTTSNPALSGPTETIRDSNPTTNPRSPAPTAAVSPTTTTPGSPTNTTPGSPPPSPPAASPAPPPPAAPSSTVATDDEATTRMNHLVSVHVLQNDDFGGSDPDLATLRVLVAPGHGTLTVAGRNIPYRPHTHYTGSDSFVYAICSLAGQCDQATVHIYVTP